MATSFEFSSLVEHEALDTTVAQHIADHGHNLKAAEAIAQDETINDYDRAVWPLLIKLAAKGEKLTGSLSEYYKEANRLLILLEVKLPDIKNIFMVREENPRPMSSESKTASVLTLKPGSLAAEAGARWPTVNGIFLTPNEGSEAVIYKKQFSYHIHGSVFFRETFPRLDNAQTVNPLELITENQISEVMEDSFANLKALVGEPCNWPADIWVDNDFATAEVPAEATVAAALAGQRIGIEIGFDKEPFAAEFCKALAEAIIAGLHRAFVPESHHNGNQTPSLLSLNGASLDYIKEMMQLLEISPPQLIEQVKKSSDSKEPQTVSGLIAATKSNFIKTQALIAATELFVEKS